MIMTPPNIIIIIVIFVFICPSFDLPCTYRFPGNQLLSNQPLKIIYFGYVKGIEAVDV
jgi:hypothetical protein